MSKNATKTKPEQQLADFRARIDAIDDRLIALFKERIGIVKQVAGLKHEHWPSDCHIRPGREGEMHRRIAAEFAGSLFPAGVAVTIWRQLIGASTTIESPLKAAVLRPQDVYLSREYFSIAASAECFSTFDEALAALSAKRCNMLLLPEPSVHDWWQRLPEGLFVFAALPVIANLPPGMGVLAVAKVMPEDSGDDVSYYVADGALHTLSGFIAPDSAEAKALGRNARWLGSHPRQLKEWL